MSSLMWPWPERMVSGLKPTKLSWLAVVQKKAPQPSCLSWMVLILMSRKQKQQRQTGHLFGCPKLVLRMRQLKRGACWATPAGARLGGSSSFIECYDPACSAPQSSRNCGAVIMIMIMIMNVEYNWLTTVNAIQGFLFCSICFQSADIRSMFPAPPCLVDFWPCPTPWKNIFPVHPWFNQLNGLTKQVLLFIVNLLCFHVESVSCKVKLTKFGGKHVNTCKNWVGSGGKIV